LAVNESALCLFFFNVKLVMGTQTEVNFGICVLRFTYCPPLSLSPSQPRWPLASLTSIILTWLCAMETPSNRTPTIEIDENHTKSKIVLAASQLERK